MAPPKDCNGDSSWVGRTHFSRSICYRLNSNSFSNLSLPLLDSDFKSKQCSDSDRASQEFHLNGRITRSDVPSDGLVASAVTSPEKIGRRPFIRHHRTLSLPSKGSTCHHEDEEACHSKDGLSGYSEHGSKVDDGSLSDVARAASWSEYFVTPGNEFAVEEAEEWMVDLSELFLGHKFASRAHSRLYLGKYKDYPVAVKILRKPDDEEDIVRLLESEFRSEINVLSRVLFMLC